MTCKYFSHSVQRVSIVFVLTLTFRKWPITFHILGNARQLDNREVFELPASRVTNQNVES